MLIIFSGLPGTGKTTLAQELARRISAVHLRIDSIEQALRGCGHRGKPLDDEGYRVAYAVAADNLQVGHAVIADQVNGVQEARDAWIEVARRSRRSFIEVEIRCSDTREHQRRVEKRNADVPGLRLPTWQEVLSRQYDPWNREHLVIDTAMYSVSQNVDAICDALRGRLTGG